MSAEAGRELVASTMTVDALLLDPDRDRVGVASEVCEEADDPGRDLRQ